jgi:type I restriction enzyme, S subunit
MGSEVSLRDMCDVGALFLTDGYRTRRDQLSADGAPILRVAHVRDGFIEVDKTDRISHDFAPRFAQKTSQVDDVVITTKGTVGRAARIPERFAGYVYSPQVCVLRVLDREVLNPAWLYCWVRSPQFQEQLDLYSGQTDMAPYVKLKDLLGFGISAPPVLEQRAIAEVLGALDDRIEWCASTSALLLELSDVLWGRAVAVDGEEVLLGDIVSFLNRRRIPLSALEREARPGPFPYYGATGVFGYVDDFLFDGNYVLVGEDGSVVNDDGTAVVQYATGRFWVNNHAHVLESERFTAEELFLALRRTVVTGYVTGAAQPKLSMGRLKQVPLRVPSGGAVDGRREAVSALFARHRAAAAEAASLRDTRDALLPRLLSGELRIEDPSRVWGAVA